MACSKTSITATPLQQASAPVEPAAVTPSEEQIGVPFYPGAKGVSGGATADLVDAQFVTSDSVDKVSSFYTGSVPGAVATGDKNETLIEFKKDGATYSIQLHRSQREGVTLISINARK